MSGGQKVATRVRHQGPETVVLTTVGLDVHALLQVPHADGPVLRVGNNEVLALIFVEDDAGHVVGVAAHTVHFPRPGLVGAPKLDQVVVRARHDHWLGWVETRPVDTTIVAVHGELDHGIGSSEEVTVDAADDAVGRAFAVALALVQTGNVPNPHSLVQRRRYEQVILGVEVSAHDVVVVASEHGETVARLPIPDPNGLVVTGGHNPRVGVVELHGAHVVQVPVEREQTPSQLVIPHFDCVVVATRHEHWLRRVKVDASHRTIVFGVFIDLDTDAVVPQLDETVVQRREDPGSVRVQGEALDPVALRLKLVQHDGSDSATDADA